VRELSWAILLVVEPPRDETCPGESDFSEIRFRFSAPAGLFGWGSRDERESSLFWKIAGEINSSCRGALLKIDWAGSPFCRRRLRRMQSRKVMITPMHTTAPAIAIPAIAPVGILRWLKACKVADAGLADGVLVPELNVKEGLIPKTVVVFPEAVVADITECWLALAEGADDVALVTADTVLWLGLGWGFTDWISFGWPVGGGAIVVPSL
jgi:hypothetical protein